MMRWSLTVLTVLLLAVWLASGHPRTEWYLPRESFHDWVVRNHFALVQGMPLHERTRWTAVIAGGELKLRQFRSASPEAAFEAHRQADQLRRQSRRRDLGSAYWLFRSFAWRRPAAGTPQIYIVVPLWAPPLAAGIPAGLVWLRRWCTRKRRRDKACRKCGYNLTGLPAAEGAKDGKPTCPECGTSSAQPPLASARIAG